MTTRTDFTPDEWALLQETVELTGTVMIATTPGGLLGESAAALSAVLDMADSTHSDELIQDLLNDTTGGYGRDDTRHRRPQHSSFTQARADLLLMCRQAAELVTGKATPQEAADYRRLVLYVAEKVARAGKEGAFLGIIGGRQVSDAEGALIAEIADALGADVPGTSEVPGT